MSPNLNFGYKASLNLFNFTDRKFCHRIAVGASAVTDMLVFSSVIFKIGQILSGLVTLLFYLFFGKNALFP